MPNPLKIGLLRHFSPNQLYKLANTRIGIAGAGGLGSNVALLLARSGIEKMLLIDQDKVDATNLNRQHYWPRHLGQNKVDALAELLLELNPNMDLIRMPIILTRDNLPDCLDMASIWVEALDKAASKSMFVDLASQKNLYLVSASGIAGYGGKPITQKRLSGLTIIGDLSSSIDQLPALAPRVSQAAALMADNIIEYILEN